MASTRPRFAGGARQESDESCGPLFRSAFPKVLKAPAELGTAEGDERRRNRERSSAFQRV